MSLKILITGGAGYIGSVLTPLLLKENYQVTVLDNFSFRQNSLLDCCANKYFEVVRGDARDERIIKNLTKDKDIIIPLAALVGAPICELEKETAVGINVNAVRLLCDSSSKSQIILYPTTNSGYGIGEKEKSCTEETPLRPISLYGKTKSEAERIILERGNSITFRLATAFGSSPRMRMDLLINDFVYRAVADKAIVIFEGHFKRNYIHIRDISKVFLHGIKNFESMKNKPYNVGLENANFSKIEVCRLIQKIIPNFIYIESAIGEDPDKRDYIVSNQRILSTGFMPDFDLELGIKELIKSYTIVKKNQYANF